MISKNHRSLVVAFAIVALFVPAVFADGVAESLNLKGTLRVRAEYWDWFETTAAEEQYVFLGSTLAVSAGQNLSGLDWNLELAAPVLIGLPDDAIAPAPQGQLGLGATYNAVNGGRTTDASVFIRQGWLNLKGLGEGNNLKIGRFGFVDGVERKHDNGNVMWLKNARIAQRLIGNFGFTHIGRSFDGVQFSHNTADHNFTVVAAAPTTGVFTVDAGSTISDVVFGYAGYTRQITSSPGEFRLFAIQYEDGRGTVKTDNRAAAVRGLDRDDLSISTLGGHWVQTFSVGSGSADVLLWGAWQTGDWGIDDHSANAYAIEAGYRFENVPSRPWVRVGYFSGSGDADPNDGDHDTFFQILPTPRVYARFPAYNLMNNKDIFAQLFLQPGTGWTLRADYHVIELNEGSDLWYAGGGAFNKGAFGFVGRPGFGKTGLMDVLDLSVDYKFSNNYSGTFYISHASGDELVDHIYPEGSGAGYIYIEFNAKF